MRIPSLILAAACVAAMTTAPAAQAAKRHHGKAVHKTVTAAPVVPLAAPAATVQFGLNMLRALGGEGNLVFSPDSIEAALAMAGTGAAGQTATQMANALALPGPWAFASVGALQGTLQSEQATAGAGNPDAPIFQIADGLFVQQGFALQAAFLSTLSANFGAAPQSVDFTTPAAVQAIDAFVGQETDGVIPQVLPPNGLDANTLLALVNAVYFKGQWVSGFDPADTRPATFSAPSGPETVPFMNQTESVPFAQTAGYSAVALPYKASTFSLLVVLPDAGVSLDSVEHELNEQTLDQIVVTMTPHELQLSLPRFHIDFAGSVIPQLQALGITDAFAPTGADFPNIAVVNPGLYLDVVQHVADITVNEQGTIAAAATVVGATAVSGVVYQPFDADRPFLFFLRDDATGALLFAGRLSDPASAQPAS